jgi:hypothetical protein
MNEKVNELTKDIWNEDIKVFNSTEALRKTLINLKIIATETNRKDEITAFASFLEQHIKTIQDGTYRIKEIVKQIAEENKNCK